MAGTIINKTYLIIDNCVLVMLNECFCDHHASQLPLQQVIPVVEEWIIKFLETLRKFTLDGFLHSTTCVADEFRPQAGRLAQRRGVSQNDFNRLHNRVCACLHNTLADIPRSRSLRGLPQAPKSLIGPGRLSDNDLSLIDLGLQLTAHRQPVYILSNDQDLIDFVSWLRTKKAFFQEPIRPALLQAWRSLTYFELVHRSCNIQTEPMRELLHFALRDHYARVDLVGTAKGHSIFQSLVDINDQFSRSIELKQQQKAVAL